MNNIELIVTDMDGTLLNQEHEISEVNTTILREAMNRGVKVVLASGRNPLNMQKYADQLGLTDTYLIGVNGQQITNLKTGVTKVIEVISMEITQMAFDIVKDTDVEFIAMADDVVINYIPPVLMEEKVKYSNETGITNKLMTGGVFAPVRNGSYDNVEKLDYDSVIRGNFNKVVFTGSPERMLVFRDLIEEKLGHLLNFVFTSNRWLEAVPLGINKGIAIVDVCRELNIDLNNAIAFGDGENDIEMFNVVGKSFAMGNALDNVKSAADEVILTNAEDGLGLHIKKLLKL